MTLTPGTRLGTYEILRSLGAGGIGEVYRARDTRLGREIAINALPAEVASFPDRLARFEREARTVAGLNHPNIVTLHSVEDEDGVRFLAMQLVEGQTLSGLVSPSGLPLPKHLELAIALTEALVAAHEKGVIHRDLKPENVMLTREGRGEADRAFEWLEHAYAQRDGGLTGTKASQRLRSLHGDTRWGAFLKKMGLGA
jgi:serine/threonine protein kinase